MSAGNSDQKVYVCVVFSSLKGGFRRGSLQKCTPFLHVALQVPHALSFSVTLDAAETPFAKTPFSRFLTHGKNVCCWFFKVFWLAVGPAPHSFSRALRARNPGRVREETGKSTASQGPKSPQRVRPGVSKESETFVFSRFFGNGQVSLIFALFRLHLHLD